MAKTARSKRIRRHGKRTKVGHSILPARSEVEIIGELRTIAQFPGFIHAFAYLVFKSNIVMAGDKFTKEDFLKIYDKSSLLRTESNLLLVLMLSAPVSLEIPSGPQTQYLVDRAVALLEELHQAVLEPGHQILREALRAKTGGAEESIDPLSSGAVLREAFFYGSESAFPFQYLDLAKKRYANDADWMLRNVGFTINDAVSVMSTIRDTLTESLPIVFKEIQQRDPSEWTFLPIFRVDIEEVMSRCGLAPQVFESVIEKFSSDENCSIAIDNISRFNPVNSSPLVRLSDGNIYSFLEYSLCECVYESPFYWICGDKKYLGKHSQSRGSFVENIIENFLFSIFGSGNVYRNIVFTPSKRATAEADVLLVHGERAFVFQAKSKRLTEKAKLGDDISIAADFQSAVQAGYDQAVACIDCLKSGVPATVSGKQIGTDRFSKIREFYPICVTSEHYPALAHQSRTLLHVVEHERVRAPLVFDIFTLDVIAEMLNKPLYFVDYLVKRSNFFEQVIANHELVVLSWYIKKNLHLEGNTLMHLEDDVLVELDLAMAVRRIGIEGPATPSGQLTRFLGTPIQKILDAVNSSDRADVHQLGELLISLGSDAAKSLNDGIATVVNLTRIDGQTHDITISVNGGGITIHCNCLSDDEAMRKLNSHCAIRKYVTESDRWYGVTFDRDGGPRLMCGLRNKWKFDPAIEAIAGDFRVNSRTKSTNLKDRKIGVNEPCPCGSGKKFKKCHGRN